MNPDEIADVAERIAAIAVELVKQVATPVYAASVVKVVETNRMGLWACVAIGLLFLGLSIICALRFVVVQPQRGARGEAQGDGWLTGVVLFLLCEVPTVIAAMVFLAQMRSAEYWAFLLVRDMLMGK